jgi:hypothetical protein
MTFSLASIFYIGQILGKEYIPQSYREFINYDIAPQNDGLIGYFLVFYSLAGEKVSPILQIGKGLIGI